MEMPSAPCFLKIAATRPLDREVPALRQGWFRRPQVDPDNPPANGMQRIGERRHGEALALGDVIGRSAGRLASGGGGTGAHDPSPLPSDSVIFGFPGLGGEDISRHRSAVPFSDDKVKTLGEQRSEA